MPDLLLELFSEEIPARMQKAAGEQLTAKLGDALKAAGLDFESVEGVYGPRRLTAHVIGLPKRSADVREERKGPKVGAPDKAVEGFLRGAGLKNIDDAEIQTDPKKGEFYVAVVETKGRETTEIVADAVPDIVRGFAWPKSMRSGTSDLRWVRPLQRILCVFDGATVPFDVDSFKSGNETEGHRVMGRGPFIVKGWDDYRSQLEGKGHVRLEATARKDLIKRDAEKLCADAGLELVEDDGLLNEVTGLAEWPVVIMGDMDPDFLTLPPEVIRLSMRTHQKYFAVRDPKSGALAPHFITVANIEASDGGATIAAGNAKVLSARLSDARFFWDNDRSKPLGSFIPKLGRVEFKKELGSMADKTERIAALAVQIAKRAGFDTDQSGVGAKLCKADLVSEMVYEFPELQGAMGRYYVLAEAGLDPLDPSVVVDKDKANAGAYSAEAAVGVANAIRDHYKPQGPSDSVPEAGPSIAVALADKLDTLTGFWAINEKPTGSKDPFALRRAALGVVRIILENRLRFGLGDLIADASEAGFAQLLSSGRAGVAVWDSEGGSPSMTLRSATGADDVLDTMMTNGAWLVDRGFEQEFADEDAIESEGVPFIRPVSVYGRDLLAFFADRLKQVLRDRGERHDLIDAVFARGEDDLMLIVSRVEALGDFLDSEDGANLMAGYKRAANILKAEEKKDGVTYSGAVDPALLEETAERDLHTAIGKAADAATRALSEEKFGDAMAALAGLRAPVDAFFEQVTVNAEEADVRRNRLLILAAIRDALHRVADVSKIEG